MARKIGKPLPPVTDVVITPEDVQRADDSARRRNRELWYLLNAEPVDPETEIIDGA